MYTCTSSSSNASRPAATAFPTPFGDSGGLGLSRAGLLRGLTAVGYLESDREAYELFRFELIATRTFRASAPGFPRLVPSTLIDPGLALRIHEVRYSIDVSDAEAIPGNLPSIEPALDHLLRGGQDDSTRVGTRSASPPAAAWEPGRQGEPSEPERSASGSCSCGRRCKTAGTLAGQRQVPISFSVDAWTATMATTYIPLATTS